MTGRDRERIRAAISVCARVAAVGEVGKESLRVRVAALGAECELRKLEYVVAAEAQQAVPPQANGGQA